MVLRRKQARGRPPKDTSSHSPPPRRAKAIASANIAAIMMDTDGPCAKIPKLELNDNPRAENSRSVLKVKDESDPAASGQNSETCAICLGQRVDPTELDNCIHSFCYTCTSQWFKYSEKCPLCMILTKIFYHNLKSPNGKEAVSVSELHTAAEAARLAERGQSQPPLDEHECIRLRIRRLQRRLSVLQAEMSKNTRDDRKLEFNMANSRLVNEISRLEMLRRDTTTRADLVSNVVFRSLIYKDNLDWNSIDRNANRVPFSPTVFREHVAESTDRIRAFLDRELPIVWRSRKPRETREQYFKHRDVVLSDIISWCGEYQINSPQFSRNLRTVGIYPQYLQRFQSELFEFASSMLTLRHFDSTSAYSSAEVRRMLERRNRRGGNQEVVTVSDSDDTDSAVIPLDSVRGRTGRRRSRRDDDVIVLSDDSLSDQDTPLHRRESNYVRDEATSSNSETSNAGDFYTRPACLLPRSQFHIGNPLRVIDAFGVLRNIYMPRPLSDASLDSMANDLPVMFPRMNLQDHQYSQNSRSRSPVGVVDNTIVLSSEDEDSDTAQRRSRRRTKELSASRVDHNEASSSSKDTIAANGISWLNPTNAGVHPTAFVPYSSSNSSEQSNTSQNGSVEHRPFGSYFVPSASRYETASCSPRPLSDSPSTSKQEHDVTPYDRGTSSQDHKSDQKPKSLFHPSPAKIYTPIEGTEVRAENKLLAKLFQERQLRNSQRKSGESVQKVCKDEMDAATMNDSVTASTASTSSTGLLQNENNKDSTMQPDSDRDAAKVPKLEPRSETPSHQSVNGEYVDVVNRELAASSSSATAGRRKHTSWSHLFKKFRKKMRHEKNQEKRERLYKFILDTKKELEKDRPTGKHVKKEDEEYNRSRDQNRHSSAVRRSTLSRYSRSKNHSQRRRRSESSSDCESRKEDRNEYEDDDSCTRRTRSRSRSPHARSSERHCSREYSKGSRRRLSSSTSTASRSWTDRGSSRSAHSRHSKYFSYSGER